MIPGTSLSGSIGPEYARWRFRRLRRVLSVLALLGMLAAAPASGLPVAPCAGDCNGDGRVAVQELVTLIRIGLHLVAVVTCAAGDVDNDGAVIVSEAMLAVSGALYDCAPPPLSIRSTSVPGGVVDLPYAVTLRSAGGTGAVTWDLAPDSGPLPPGLDLSTEGLVSGTPTTPGQFQFTVRALDSGEPQDADTQLLTIRVVAPLVIRNASLINGTVGISFSAFVLADGGLPPVSFAVVAGDLPPGLGLAPGAGEILGNPTTGGSFDFTIRATDSLDPAQTDSRDYEVLILEIPAQLLPDGVVDAAYNRALDVTGRRAPVTWELIGGAPPPGLGLASNGTILGTPTAAGAFAFQVQVTDSDSPPRSHGRMLAMNVVNPVPTINGLDPSSAQAGSPAFELRVIGDKFVPGAVVRWNGANRTTRFTNKTMLLADIPASDVEAAGSAAVTVLNPGPGGGVSNPLTFTIRARLAVGVVAAVSVSSAGEFDNGRPDLNAFGPPAISANGRYVAFVSGGSNLVPGVPVGAKNRVYLRDTCINAPPECTPSTTWISEPRPDATDADLMDARFPSISADGRYVLFFGRGKFAPYSDFSFLDRSTQAVVRDTCNGAPPGCQPRSVTLPERPDIGPGARGQRINRFPVRGMSADGRFVLLPDGCSIDAPTICPGLPDGVFASLLVDRDADGNGIFDEDGGSTNVVVVIPQDGAVTLIPNRPFLSPTGTSISFQASDTQPPAAPNSRAFVQRLLDGARFKTGGVLESLGVDQSGPFSAEDDEVLVYWSATQTSGPPTPAYREDVFRIDRPPAFPPTVVTRDAEGNSANNGRPTDGSIDISASGRFVSFLTFGGNLAAGDTNETVDVYVWDSCLSAPPECVPEHRQVSLTSSGAQLNGGAFNHVMSANAQYVVFATNGLDTNILPGGTPNRPQLYIARTAFSE